MAVRRVNGSDSDFILFGAVSNAIQELHFGAFTIAVLMKKEVQEDSFQGYVTGEVASGPTNRRALITNTSNQLVGQLGGFNINTPTVFEIADGWSVVAIRKAVGSVTLKGSKGILGGAWTHDDGDAGFDDSSGTSADLAQIRVGMYQAGTLNSWALYAVVGIWARELSQAELEDGLRTSYQEWLDKAPDALYKFNQAVVSTAVQDDSGNGNHQTDRSGTTVITGDDPPGFDFVDPASVTVTPATVTVNAVDPTIVLGSVIVTLEPASLTIEPVSFTVVPEAVVITLSPGEVTTESILTVPLAEANVMLTSAVVTLAGEPLVTVPGGLTVLLEVAEVQLMPRAIGQVGADIDITVIVGPSRANGVQIGSNRNNSIEVALSRMERNT